MKKKKEQLYCMEISKISDLDRQLQNTLQMHLQGKMDEALLKELSKNLFPVVSEDLFGGFYNALITFFVIRYNRNIVFQQILKDFFKKCEEIGHKVPQIMIRLFQGDFKQKFKSKFSQLKDAKDVINLLSFMPREEKAKDKQTKKNDAIVISSTKPKDHTKQSPVLTSSTKVGSKHDSHKKNLNSEVDCVINLADRGVCLCDKEVGTQQSSFTCVHCNRSYHLECMKKKKDAKYCSMCHLKKMLPNKEVKKVLFLGVLKKSKKKHEFTIYLSDQDLAMKYRLQVRSIRIKELTQYFILFPDYTNVMLNNYSVKEFQPLHRQSSLKYRKDQPFLAEIKHLVPKENKVVIHQKLPTKETKEERIQVENHLIGFFLVEDRKIEQLVKQIAINCVTSFQQSRKVLQSSFGVGGGEQVTCQVVKIPLTCTLSTQRIKLPARGVFCTHYQCFDLYNFMIVTSSSANPKWICPLCKSPAYEFKVDCIMSAILTAYAEEKATEVMFFKSGDIKVHAGDRLLQGKVNTIHELLIENAGSRIIQPLPEPEKKRKKKDFNPSNKDVIPLD